MAQSITPEYLEKTADPVRVRHMLMVGGLAAEDEPGRLCTNDVNTIQRVARLFSNLNIPLSADFNAAQDCKHHVSAASYDIVNPDNPENPLDFRDYKGKADAVVFCNIPVGNEARKGLEEHEIPQFRDALERSDAKIAWISGADSFKAYQICGDKYVTFRTEDPGQSFLLRKDYLEDLEEYAHLLKTPMSPMMRFYHVDHVTSFSVETVRDHKRTEAPYVDFVVKPLPSGP